MIWSHCTGIILRAELDRSGEMGRVAHPKFIAGNGDQVDISQRPKNRPSETEDRARRFLDLDPCPLDELYKMASTPIPDWNLRPSDANKHIVDAIGIKSGKKMLYQDDGGVIGRQFRAAGSFPYRRERCWK